MAEIQITKLSVPPYVSRGDQVEMRCQYALASYELYSIKWYKDDDEFFRFIPSEIPSKYELKVSGVKVNVSTNSF